MACFRDVCKVVGLVCNVGLLPGALGPSFLDKGVGTGSTETHLGPSLLPFLLNAYFWVMFFSRNSYYCDFSQSPF